MSAAEATCVRLVAAQAIVEADRVALRDLWRTAWAAAYRSRLSETEWARLSAILDTPGLEAMAPTQPGWAAIVDEPIGGRALASAVGKLVPINASPRLFVWGCYVRPGWLRRGLGTRALGALVAAAPPDATVELNVLDAARDAHAFYRAFGFVAHEACAVALGGRLLPACVLRADASHVLFALARRGRA